MNHFPGWKLNMEVERCAHTYTPDNPLLVDDDWPFRRIDYVLVRCGEHGVGLQIRDCRVVGDDPSVSDHYGLLADLEPDA